MGAPMVHSSVTVGSQARVLHFTFKYNIVSAFTSENSSNYTNNTNLQVLFYTKVSLGYIRKVNS